MNMERVTLCVLAGLTLVTLATLAIPRTRTRAVHEAREMYRSLPGPHWVKVAIIVACLAIPGPQDEILLLVIVAACRYVRSRRMRCRG